MKAAHAQMGEDAYDMDRIIAALEQMEIQQDILD
jgi:hypothetical protein